MAPPAPPFTPSRPIVTSSPVAPRPKRTIDDLQRESSPTRGKKLKSLGERYRDRMAEVVTKEWEKRTGTKLNVNPALSEGNSEDDQAFPKKETVPPTTAIAGQEFTKEVPPSTPSTNAPSNAVKSVVELATDEEVGRLAANEDSFVKVNKAEKEAEKTFWGA